VSTCVVIRVLPFGNSHCIVPKQDGVLTMFALLASAAGTDVSIRSVSLLGCVCASVHACQRVSLHESA